MKNFEKYENEVREYNGDNFCRDFVIPHILKKDNCAYPSCSDCGRRQMLWFVEEYEESQVDWSKVEVDTPILVKFKEDKEWKKRHFAKYENGRVYAWKNSHSSWTSLHNDDVTFWSYAKLAEDEKECKEPEVDWSKVEVDTPILVRDAKYRRWVKRYFAKYNNGTIFAWTIGCTSRDAHNMMTPWKYAKLAKNEK